MDELTTPVALILFNRPDLVAAVFAAIRAARPTRLFLIADGPRRDHLQRGFARRGRTVDWPARSRRIYAGENLGCNQRHYRVWIGFARVEEQSSWRMTYCRAFVLTRIASLSWLANGTGARHRRLNALGEWAPTATTYYIGCRQSGAAWAQSVAALRLAP
ncbi:MAG: hypothetical protein H6643_03135 [Caldilineaceae bacterium]|nr:hypothetical protein [Caldilineaceae bacterium]